MGHNGTGLEAAVFSGSGSESVFIHNSDFKILIPSCTNLRSVPHEWTINRIYKRGKENNNNNNATTTMPWRFPGTHALLVLPIFLRPPACMHALPRHRFLGRSEIF